MGLLLCMSAHITAALFQHFSELWVPLHTHTHRFSVQRDGDAEAPPWPALQIQIRLCSDVPLLLVGFIISAKQVRPRSFTHDSNSSGDLVESFAPSFWNFLMISRFSNTLRWGPFTIIFIWRLVIWLLPNKKTKCSLNKAKSNLKTPDS